MGPSVRLVVPDAALLDAAIEGPEALSRALGCAVAENWEQFPEALPATRDALVRDPGSARWGTRFFLLEEPPALVGWGGFKGPPDDGQVELGYSVAPAFWNRGIAAQAVRAMLEEAFADGAVTTAIAHTIEERGPSARVLEKTGFERAGSFEDEGRAVWRWRCGR